MLYIHREWNKLASRGILTLFLEYESSSVCSDTSANFLSAFWALLLVKATVMTANHTMKIRKFQIQT
jgi:hypothetical protein